MARRPPLASIAREDEVLDELRIRTPQRGMRKAIAQDAHVSESHLSKMAHRTKPVTPSLAAVLGFKLAWVRADELALADKIEAELARPSVLKDGE